MMPPMEAPDHAREPAAPIWRWLRWTLRAAMLACVACAALICGGFVWFIYHVPAEEVALTRNADGSWRRERGIHHQRHHPRSRVESALRQAGLEPVAVRGMRLDGTVTSDFDELDNSKAVYVARASAPEG